MQEEQKDMPMTEGEGEKKDMPMGDKPMGDQMDPMKEDKPAE